jgi:hypothetical protein
VYDEIGGNEAFAKWAKLNPTEFYKLFAKLLPRDIHASMLSASKVEVVVAAHEMEY